MDRSRERRSEAIYELLNTAFDGWGDEAYFRFKYTDFPEYDPLDHNFLADDNGEIIAARRVFVKHLTTAGGSSQPVHIHGGAVVHPDYRQQGLFTDLVDDSREYSHEKGSPVVMTFNRRGKVSTQAHMRRDWQYRSLPLHIRPLSPKPLIDEHAGDVLPNLPGFELVTTVGGTAASIVLPDWAVARSVELATSGSVTQPRTPYGDEKKTESDATVRPYETKDLDAVSELFEQKTSHFDLAFERDRRTIEHMIGYDHAESGVAVHDGSLVGFVCVGLIHQSEQIEARVFDLVSTTEDVGSQLLDWVVTNGRQRSADVISILQNERPGPRWASLNTDLVMWDYLQDRDDWHHPLSDGDWRITAYDVL